MPFFNLFGNSKEVWHMSGIKEFRGRKVHTPRWDFNKRVFPKPRLNSIFFKGIFFYIFFSTATVLFNVQSEQVLWNGNVQVGKEKFEPISEDFQIPRTMGMPTTILTPFYIFFCNRHPLPLRSIRTSSWTRIDGKGGKWNWMNWWRVFITPDAGYDFKVKFNFNRFHFLSASINHFVRWNRGRWKGKWRISWFAIFL